jgi:hypothetical protein
MDTRGILQPDGLLRQISQILSQVPPVGLKRVQGQATLFTKQFKISLQVEIHCLLRSLSYVLSYYKFNKEAVFSFSS